MRTERTRNEERSSRAFRGLTILLVWTVLMGTVALVAQAAASASVGAPGVDWWAAAQLPPIESAAPGGPTLARTEVADIVCIGDDACVASTERPMLTTDIAPDNDGTYRFVVYDVTGSGGTTTVAAEHVGPDPQWAPPAGLLEHGHTYAWTVHGDPDVTPDFEQFLVDVQRSMDQPIDSAGPFGVGLGSGALFLEVGAANTAEGPLGLAYTTPGPSTPSMLPDGWTIAGDVLAPIRFVRVETFADGTVVILHGMDGTALRYERDEQGRYAPPSIDGRDLSFVYPHVSPYDTGWQVVEPNGATSTFAADGNLARVESIAPDGTVRSDVEVVAVGGQLQSITDAASGQEITFTYVGDRGYRPPAGFDRGSSEPRIGQITGSDGTVTNLAYIDGQLARVETAGATLDLAYDESGRLVEVREPIAADAAAAGVRADDASIRWSVAYDDLGRVAQVTSPEPSAGEAPMVRSYQYGDGTTTVFAHGADGPQEAVNVRFDPNDLRPLSQSLAGLEPTTYLYNADGSLLGTVDPTGMQTTFVRDEGASTVTIYGPSPAEWFGADGTPLPEHAAEVTTQTRTTGGGSGMHASFYDSTELGSAAAAVRLLTSGEVTAPAGIDVATGWRMTGSGNPTIDAGETRFRLTGDAAESSSLVVNGVTCALGEECVVEAEEAGTAMLLIDLRVPAGQSAVSFHIERSTDGETWQEIALEAFSGNDLPTTDTTTDTYRLGDAPVATTESIVYEDASIGTVGAELRDGQTLVQYSNEPLDPETDRWARPDAITRPSGLTTTIDYWGSAEWVAHPLTGEQMLQAGARKNLRVGDGATYTMIYDNTGYPVATLSDGELVEAMVLDQRGRVERKHVAANGNAPALDNEVIYGADGDPLRTDVVVKIGDEEYFTSATTDLLGRTVSGIDVWGTTSEFTYDQLGNLVSTVTTTTDGTTTTHTRTWGPEGFVGETVVAADGTTYSATVTARDRAGRPTAIRYSNGVTVEYTFDPATGTPNSVWTDGNGNPWTETITSSPQTGRTLQHELESPTTDAVFRYGYEPTSGALTDATLDVTGEAQLTADWEYLSRYTDGTCPIGDSGAVLDGARAHTVSTVGDVTTTTTTCYDADGAPTSHTHLTSTPEGDTTTDIDIVVASGNVVAYNGTTLEYDALRRVVRASDATTTVELTRTADGNMIEQRRTDDGKPEATMRYSGAGLVLDQHGVALSQAIKLAGDVTIDVPLAAADDAGATWSYPTIGKDVWWTSDDAGTPTSDVPLLYSPDGQALALDGDAAGVYGWKAGASGQALGLDSTMVLFGARLYIPDLASFTTPDPQAHGGSTQFNYANGDSINLVDPTGLAPQWLEKFTTWLDNLPWWAELIMIGAIFIAAMIPFIGTGLAAALTMVLAGYYVYRAVSSFFNGDIAEGVVYSLYAIATIAGFRWLSRASASGKQLTTIKTTRYRVPAAGKIGSKLKAGEKLKFAKSYDSQARFEVASIAENKIVKTKQLVRETTAIPSQSSKSFSAPAYNQRSWHVTWPPKEFYLTAVGLTVVWASLQIILLDPTPAETP